MSGNILSPKKNDPDKPEPGKKERPVEPKLPEILPNPKEMPAPETEEPEKVPPEVPVTDPDKPSTDFMTLIF